ncbi:MAG: hypothetical protein QOE38_2410 [Thermoleophilaceae bacterium]|nr:hypothetical protein [Thermoleophilaceae bacterium]
MTDGRALEAAVLAALEPLKGLRAAGYAVP